MSYFGLFLARLRPDYRDRPGKAIRALLSNRQSEWDIGAIPLTAVGRSAGHEVDLLTLVSMESAYCGHCRGRIARGRLAMAKRERTGSRLGEDMSADLLAKFAAALAGGSIKVIDLTQTLKPATPVIQLPPPLAQSDPFSVTEISHYDERGPAWYWNNLKLGEHTGTHFDAPIHWITGKDFSDGATDTLPSPASSRRRSSSTARRRRRRTRNSSASRHTSRRGRRSTAAFRTAPGC